MAQPRTRSTSPEVSKRTGEKVRRLRLERGWSYLDLHDEIVSATWEDPQGPTSISQAVLRNIEEGITIAPGTRKPRWIEVGEARALAMAFGVSIDNLVNG